MLSHLNEVQLAGGTEATEERSGSGSMAWVAGGKARELRARHCPRLYLTETHADASTCRRADHQDGKESGGEALSCPTLLGAP